MQVKKERSQEGQFSQLVNGHNDIDQQLCSIKSTFLVTRVSENIPSLVNSDAISTEESHAISLYDEPIENVNPFETISKNKLLDILPSYEMFNSLYKNVPQGTTPLANLELPPFYGNEDNAQDLESIPNSELEINEQTISVNEIYSLPKVNAPIKIEIVLTKDAVIPPLNPEKESVLREYSCGDIVHGYLILENLSKEPIRFEMFYVTLEGYISIYNRKTQEKTVKRFLRMVDMSASWSSTNIDIGTGLRYICGRKDFDDCQLGLNNDRYLQPGAKYKKIFMFKLPTQLLDNVCDHEDGPHSLPPPSFGFDNFINLPIKVNEALGYGHVGVRGSPLLTDDHSGEDVAVIYSVNARLLGKNKKKKGMNILQDSQYHIRFIPYEFREYFDQYRNSALGLKELRKSVKSCLSQLEAIFTNLGNKQSTILGSNGEFTPDDITSANDNIKLMQLARNDHTEGKKRSDFKPKNSSSIESDLHYSINDQNGLFSKFFIDHNGINQTKNGIIVVSTEKPQEPLEYWIPKLLRKYNSNSQNSSQTKNSKSLTLKLTCIQSNNTIDHLPPAVKNISTQLLLITTKSSYPVPLPLNSLFAMKLAHCESLNGEFTEYRKQVDEYHEKFKADQENLIKIHQEETGLDLNFGDLFSKQLYTDLKSLESLQTKIDTLDFVFKKTKSCNRNHKLSDNKLNHVSGNKSTGWTKTTSREYEREIILNLEYADDLQTTLIPSFESCLCSRFYVVRVTITFSKAGSVILDIPIDISR